MLLLVSLCTVGAAEFTLFEDFNIERTALQLSIDDPFLYNKLSAMRRVMTRPGMSFYLNKIRFKTYLQAEGVDIPTVYYMDQFKDTSELWMNRWLPLEHHEEVVDCYAKRILENIETRSDYVAKVSHLSYGDGVMVIKDFDTNLLARGYALANGADPSMPAKKVAKTLAKILHYPPTYQTDESWALYKVPPGLVVEERLTVPNVAGYDADDAPAMEFKTFTIWGKAFITIWCQAGQVHGMVFRNGTARVTTAGQHANGTGYILTSTEETALPEWLDWPRIVATSERLGAHKDMFRTDMFVGVPAGGTRALDQLKYVVSEVEIHSTYGLGNLEQATGRLWLQGYLDHNYAVVPNHEHTSSNLHAEL